MKPIKLNEIQKRILRRLTQDDRDLNLQQIERKIKMSHSWTQENLKLLEKRGLLTSAGKNPRFYSLTEQGKNIAIRLDHSVGDPDIRSHAIQLTFPIIQKPGAWSYDSRFIKVSDEIRMRNWTTEIRARWHGNYCLISDSSISLFITSLHNPDIKVNVMKALFLALHFARYMEISHEGLKLGVPNKGSVIFMPAQEHALPLPQMDLDSFESDSFAADFSKGYPEVDFKGRSSVDSTERFKTFMEAVVDNRISAESFEKLTSSVDRLLKREITYTTYRQAVEIAKTRWRVSREREEREDSTINLEAL